jgi:hypothetical protein
MASSTVRNRFKSRKYNAQFTSHEAFDNKGKCTQRTETNTAEIRRQSILVAKL